MQHFLSVGHTNNLEIQLGHTNNLVIPFMQRTKISHCKTKYVHLSSSIILRAHARSYVDITDVALQFLKQIDINIHISITSL